jgi:hypothetical protein
MTRVREFCLALLAGGTAFTLQGCGGGSSTTTPNPSPISTKCINEQFDVVTQSSSMHSTVTIKQANIKQANIKMTGQFKVDVANWNMRVDMKITGDITAELSVVLNTQKKHAAFKWNVIDGPPDYKGYKCSRTSLPSYVTPAYISSAWSKSVKPMLKQLLSCAGHDGTHDTFTGNLDDLAKLREQFPQIPEVDGTNADVNIKLSKDGLIHGYDATVRQVSADSSYQMTAEMSDVIAKGPSEADLDFSGWKDCQEDSIDALPLKGDAAQMHMLLNMIHKAAKKEEVATIV